MGLGRVPGASGRPRELYCSGSSIVLPARPPMPMTYEHDFIPAAAVPRARLPLLQHVVDTYASETSKTAGVWTELRDDQLEFRPHPRSSSVRQILVHQILSRAAVLRRIRRPRRAAGRDAAAAGRRAGGRRLCGAARGAGAGPGWRRWRRRRGLLARRGAVLRCAAAAHLGRSGVACSTPPIIGPRWASALRLLEDRVPPTYGPTADVTWSGADPTTTLDAARRRGA